MQLLEPGLIYNAKNCSVLKEQIPTGYTYFGYTYHYFAFSRKTGLLRAYLRVLYRNSGSIIMIFNMNNKLKNVFLYRELKVLVSCHRLSFITIY